MGKVTKETERKPETTGKYYDRGIKEQVMLYQV